METYKTNWKFITLFGCATLLLSPVTAQAQIITVPNFSFENPVLSAGGATTGGNGNTTAAPNWTIKTLGAGSLFNGGVFNAVGTYASIPDGTQTAYLNIGGTSGTTAASLTSGNLTTIAAGTEYTLTVDLGNRTGVTNANTSNFTISLLDNGINVATTSVAGNTITQGTFAPLTLNYTPVTGFGDQLQVQLGFALSSGSASAQGNFDNVQFSDQAIPEPSAWAMMLLGLGVMVGLRSFRRGTSVIS